MVKNSEYSTLLLLYAYYLEMVKHQFLKFCIPCNFKYIHPHEHCVQNKNHLQQLKICMNYALQGGHKKVIHITYFPHHLLRHQNILYIYILNIFFEQCVPCKM